MKRLHFYISNPNHHWQMMKAIINVLPKKQFEVSIISLCEFRRMESPQVEVDRLGVRLIRLASLKVKGATTSTGKTFIGGNQAFIRNALRFIAWVLKVNPSLKRANQIKPDLIVVPNDIAFPFDKICTWFTKNDFKFILMQEGIRFPLPNEEGQKPYGTNGASEIFAWGNHSADYFKSLKIESTIHVIGNPRLDTFFNRDANLTTKIELPLDCYNIMYVSNPVDDQGFCSHQTKVELFKRFLDSVRELLLTRQTKLFVRLHPREDISSFKEVIPAVLESRVEWTQGFDLMACLREMNFTVILASTVGLESMMVGTPVGVIRLAGYGYVFNYVSSGCALGIDLDKEDTPEMIWKAITVDKEYWKEKSKQFVDLQLANQGKSAKAIGLRLMQKLT